MLLKIVTSVLLGFAANVVAGPCDIYQKGNTPCVAAHSTTRALFSAYTGPLYQVRRASDGMMSDIHPLSAGGPANSSSQDKFCAKTTCVISIIYDQTEKGNRLTRGPKGSIGGGADNLANAAAAPVKLNGHKVYGVAIEPGMGYRNDKTNGIATGSAAEGIYNVIDGTKFNGNCCFDYGNAETDNTDHGPSDNGAMEAIYFGTAGIPSNTTDKGPRIRADLENGLFPSLNTHPVPAISHRFVHAVLKGSADHYAIAGGDATSGALKTFVSTTRHYPSRKQGAILLGVGGDNSHAGTGTFYEGVMTAGVPSDGTDAAVQADIVAAKYSV